MWECVSKGNQEGIGDGEKEELAWKICLGSLSMDFKAFRKKHGEQVK